MIIQFPQVLRPVIHNPPAVRPIVMQQPTMPIGLMILAASLLLAYAAVLGIAYSQIWGGM